MTRIRTGTALAIMAVRTILLAAGLVGLVAAGRAETVAAAETGSRIVPGARVTAYTDGRPSNFYRLDAVDQGVVLRHGDGPGGSDRYGARDVWVFRHDDTIYLHYDAAGPLGWLAALAVSRDGVNFETKGPILTLGKPGDPDSASASYGTTYFDGRDWHLFYLGTPNATPAPGRIPAFPYMTLKARAPSPAGPWTKQPAVVPFAPKPGSYYNNTASPGPVIRRGDQYWQFFSAGQPRTIGIARARDLDGPWTVDPQPILPGAEQIENASFYVQAAAGQVEAGQGETGHAAAETWFLFTNHVGIRDGVEFTDAIWVYWSQDPEHWDPAHKAVVLDGRTSGWSKTIIGLPSVLRIGDRLAIFYDGQADTPKRLDEASHLNRDIGLAWLALPIALPDPSSGAKGTTFAEPQFEETVAMPQPVEAAAAEPEPAALTQEPCLLDVVNQVVPAEVPVTAAVTLDVHGWAVVSGKDGTVPDAVLLTLTPEGGRAYTVTTHPEPRPDVAAHLGRPGMPDPGFGATIDVRHLSGPYRLGVARRYQGRTYACAASRSLILGH